MRKFVDLRLCAPLNDLSLFEKMIARAYELGYSAVGTPLPPQIKMEEVERLRAICKNVNVDFVTRVELAPRDPKELLTFLKHYRRGFEVVSVLCYSKAVARQAAKDRRVDLLSFSDDPRKRFFDEAEAELASKASASLEIEARLLLKSCGFVRAKLISTLRKEVAIAERLGVPIVLSSGSPNVLLMRGPRELEALASLFDLSQPSALKAVSDNPLSIVKKNRDKLSPNYVAPGLRMVRKAKCSSA